MNADFLKYLSIIFILIFVFLVVSNGSASTNVLNSLSRANTNAILALQGRNPQ